MEWRSVIHQQHREPQKILSNYYSGDAELQAEAGRVFDEAECQAELGATGWVLNFAWLECGDGKPVLGGGWPAKGAGAID